MEKDLIGTRRFYHKIAEPGWLEFRTSINIIKDLKKLGLSDIKYGKKIHKEDMIFGRPSSERLKAYAATIKYREDFDTSEILQGYTGLIATIDTEKPGKTFAFRFDIDALPIKESADKFHKPLGRALRRKIREPCTLAVMMATYPWEFSLPNGF